MSHIPRTRLIIEHCCACGNYDHAAKLHTELSKAIDLKALNIYMDVVNSHKPTMKVELYWEMSGKKHTPAIWSGQHTKIK